MYIHMCYVPGSGLAGWPLCAKPADSYLTRKYDLRLNTRVYVCMMLFIGSCRCVKQTYYMLDKHLDLGGATCPMRPHQFPTALHV